MKAAVHEAYGGGEVIKILEMPKPSPKEGEVLIKVSSVALNPIDWKILEGIMKDVPDDVKIKPAEGKPATLGHDVSGVVEELGAGVEGFAVGDAVYGFPTLYAGAEALAEYVSLPAKMIAPKPKSVSHTEAASLVMVAQTMFQAYWNTGVGILPGMKVIVLGASGGTGNMAVQLAKMCGAHVIATCSAKNAAVVKELGAAEIVDYRTENVWEKFAGAGIDVVVDTVGEVGSWDKSKTILAEDGAFVSIIPDHQIPTGKHMVDGLKRYYDILVTSKAEDLCWITRAVDKGLLKPLVDRVFKFEESAAAFDYLKEGHAVGKVVIDLA